MTVTWDTYKPNTQIDRPYDELSRQEARSFYDQLMASKHERIEMLRRLLAANGVDLGSCSERLRDLEEWFRENMERDPDDLGRPSPHWLSVTTDIGLFIGDTIIDREPGVTWRFLDRGKRHIAYQRPVLAGFDVPNPDYVVDPLRLIYDYALRIIEGSARRERDTLEKIVKG